MEFKDLEVGQLFQSMEDACFFIKTKHSFTITNNAVCIRRVVGKILVDAKEDCALSSDTWVQPVTGLSTSN